MDTENLDEKVINILQTVVEQLQSHKESLLILMNTIKKGLLDMEMELMKFDRDKLVDLYTTNPKVKELMDKIETIGNEISEL